jgi:hypothetical protein
LESLENFVKNRKKYLDGRIEICYGWKMQNRQILYETIVEFPQVSQLPGSPSRASVLRWCLDGVESKFSGELITLEWAQLGTHRVTSEEAYDRFLARLNGETNAVPS